MNNSHNKAEKFWDRMSGRYEKEEAGDEPALLKIIEKTKIHLNGSDTILDFGCATGLVSNRIAGYVKSVKAIDISSRMIAVAEAKAIKDGIKNIDYEQSTIFDSRHNIGSFDTVLAFYILHLLRNPAETVERLSELIKPGGMLISATPCLGEHKFLKWLFSIGSKLGVIPDVKSFKYEELLNILEDGNFEIVEADCLNIKSQQYFIIARNIKDSGQQAAGIVDCQ